MTGVDNDGTAAADEGGDAVDLDRRRAQLAAMFALEQVHALVQHRLSIGFTEQGLDDVTPAQAGALAVLFELREATTSTVARRLGLADVTVGRFVAALERCGYVHRRRNPRDGREQLLSPTAKARSRLPDFVAVTNQVLDGLFGDLDTDAVAQLTAGLVRAADRLGGPVASAPRMLTVAARGGTGLRWPGTGPDA